MILTWDGPGFEQQYIQDRVRVQSENQCTGVHLSEIPNLEGWKA